MRRSSGLIYLIVVLLLSFGCLTRISASPGPACDRIPLDSLTAMHAPGFLQLPAFYGGWDEDDSAACLGSSHALHPSVLYVPERFLGYRFWMAYTPICISESDENPHIAVSNDGYTWGHFVSEGADTLHNPIFDRRQFSATHLSDPDILFDSLTGLWMVFRATWEIAGVDSHAVYISNTTDGLNWSTPEKVLSDGLLQQGGPSAFMSPSLVTAPNGSLDLYVVEPRASGLTFLDTSRVVRYRAGTAANQFAFVDTCEWSLPVDTLKIWHLEILPAPDGSLAALVTLAPNRRLNYGTLAELYVSESLDSGHTWTTASAPLLSWQADTSAWYGQAVYRASGFWLPCEERTLLQLYYSGISRPEWEGGGGTGWQTGVTTAGIVDLSTPACVDLEVNGLMDNPRVAADSLILRWIYADPVHSDLGRQLEVELYEGCSVSGEPCWTGGPAACGSAVFRYPGPSLLPGISYTARLRMSNGLAWSPWCFATLTVNSPPNVPQLLVPSLEACVLTEMTPRFVWSGGDPDPNDTVTYRLSLANDNSDWTWISEPLTDTTLSTVDSLAFGRTYSWKITAEDLLGAAVESATDSIRTWLPGDIDNDGLVAITDLVYLADYLFREGDAPCDPRLGDVSGSCRIDIADLTYLVDLLFRGGPAAVLCDQ